MSVGIQEVEGVESVKVNLNQGLAAVKLKPGNTVRLEQLHDVVRSKGFTPKQAQIVAKGHLARANGKLEFQISGAQRTYPLEAPPGSPIHKLAGKTLLIKGAIPADQHLIRFTGLAE